MKRNYILFTSLIFLIAISACTSSEPTAQVGSDSTPAISESIPTITIDSDTEMDGENVQSDASQAESEAASEEVMADDAANMTEDVMVEEEDMADDAADMTEDVMVEEEEMADDAEIAMEPAVDRPPWQHLSLIDARTGESFSLADFEGKTVFVEPMATWCSNCRRQLTNVIEARQQLASDDVVFVALSVETNIDDATLADYADQAGFDWLFAVATPDMLRQLANEFGQSITNPPATPHFIIRGDGSFTELVTGIDPPEQIVSQIVSAQG